MALFPWGTLVSLAGQAASGIMSTLNNRAAKQEQEAEDARAIAAADARAAEDPLGTRTAQSAMARYDRSAKKQVERAEAMGKITGATPEQAIATQEAVANGRSDLMGELAAMGDKNEQAAKDKAEEARQQRSKNQQAYRASRNQTYANLAANAASAFGGILDSYTASKASAAAQAAPVIKESIVTCGAGKAGTAATKATPVTTVTPGNEVSRDGRMVHGTAVADRANAPKINLNPSAAVADTSGLSLKTPPVTASAPSRPVSVAESAPMNFNITSDEQKKTKEERYRPFER